MQRISIEERPKTLLELAGVRPQRVDWGTASLLLIDFQVEYITGALPLGANGTAAVNRAERLLQTARANAAPVVHVVHHGRPGGPTFDPQTANVGIVDSLAPRGDEPVVVKGLPNAFSGTGLLDILQRTERKHLLVAGFMSHMCVSSTVRAALDHGFQCFVCDDACATRPLPAGSRVVSAETLHDAEMAALSDRFATVLTVTDIVAPVA